MSFRPEILLCSRPALRVFYVLLIGFLLTTAAGINRSSLGEWKNFVGVQSKDSTLLGKSHPIRSDEWLVATPWVLSQINASPAFPQENPTIGPGKAALLSGVPTWHFSSFFRPHQWGFFIFPEEFGFAWLSMLGTWGVIASLFALGLLLYNGSVPLALTSSLWILFSPFTQWWFSTWYPSLLMSSALAGTALLVLLYASSKRAIVCSWLGLFWASGITLLSIYPPFVIVVGFFIVAVILSALLRYGIPQGTFKAALPRVTIALSAVLLAGCFTLVFFMDVSEAVRALQATVYPGSRVSLGGDFSWHRYLSGFFGAFMTEEIFPRSYGNICETSSFILLWPLVFVLACSAGSKKHLVPLLPLFVLCLVLSVWEVWGFPLFLAKSTLLTMVPPVRAQAGLGPASIMLLLMSMSVASTGPGRPGKVATFLLCVLVFIAVVLFGAVIDDDMREQLGLFGTLASALGVCALSWAILRRNVALLAVGVLALVVYPGLHINPIARGMGPLENVPLLKELETLHAQDPSARWAAYGENVTPNLLGVTGVSVFNGMKLIPDLETLKVFDPAGTHRDIYNRLAQMVLESAPDEADPAFKLVQADLWVLKVSPCHPAFSEINVRYFVFRAPFQFEKNRCLELLTPHELPGGFWILRRKS